MTPAELTAITRERYEELQRSQARNLEPFDDLPASKQGVLELMVLRGVRHGHLMFCRARDGEQFAEGGK